MIEKYPERVAWLVILGAFAMFLILCASVPLGVRYYLRHATTSQPAKLEVIGGTIRVREPGSAAPIAVTQARSLLEGLRGNELALGLVLASWLLLTIGIWKGRCKV